MFISTQLTHSPFVRCEVDDFAVLLPADEGLWVAPGGHAAQRDVAVAEGGVGVDGDLAEVVAEEGDVEGGVAAAGHAHGVGSHAVIHAGVLKSNVTILVENHRFRDWAKGSSSRLRYPGSYCRNPKLR